MRNYFYDKINSLKLNCAYYQNTNYKCRDISTWPILEKKDVVLNYDKFTKNTNAKECIISSTSGSSGMIVDTLWAPQDYYASVAQMWRVRNRYGITPQLPFATCHATAYQNEKLLQHRIIVDKNIISFSKLVTDDNILMSYLRELKRSNVTWLLMQPSLLLKLIACSDKFNIKLPKISYIECTGEILTNEVKDYIIAKFKPNALINSYGMQEFNTIGYDLGRGFNLLSDNVYLEVISDELKMCREGEIGKIVISGLMNRTMPYLRYNTGDYGTIISGKLHLLNAGVNDSFTFDDRTFDGSVFWDMIDFIRKNYFPILQFHFVYLKNDLYAYLYVYDRMDIELSKLNDIIKSYLLTKYGIQFDNVFIELKSILEYTVNNKAKHQYFVNKNLI